MRTSSACGLFITSAVLAMSTAWAQKSGQAPPPEQPIGMVAQPCPPALSLPAPVHDLLVELFIQPRQLTAADLDRLTKNPQFMEFSQASRLHAQQDWSGLCHYRAANETASSTATPPRVVFMGDSITENWGLADPAFFESGTVNRGISGQTTPQMLVRFRQDVIALKPRAVHILAGTNDVAGNTGPNRPEDFENNIMSMAELARAHQIHVMLASIPPTARFNWRPQLNPVQQIRELNQWLRDYATRNGFDFIDYYSALVGPAGELKPELSNDGVHPNSRGYRIMRALFEQHDAKR
jgi:lysophospholipase L1-like esterase